MHPNEPRVPAGRAPIAFILVILVAATACSPEPPKPSASPAATTEATAPPKIVGDLGLEMCDPQGLLPCEHQAVFLSEPIAASGLSLTYSTEWADGRIDRPRWNADSLGLGGWSLDILQRYDPERRILLSGDGSWRFADAVEIGPGERAVPTFDGFRYFVFDGAWRHVRTVDAITGATLLTITYDAAGRVTGVTGAAGGRPVSLTVDRAPDGSLRYLAGLDDTRTVAVVGAGGLAAIGRPDGTILGVSYIEHGLIANWQTTGRGVVEYAWDDAGRLTKATDPDSVWRELAFEGADGSMTITVTDADGAAAIFRAERAGDVLRRTFTDTDRTVTQLDTNADASTRLVGADGTTTTVGAVPHPRWALAAPVLTPIVERRADGTGYRVDMKSTMGAGSPQPAGGAWQTEYVVGDARWTDSYDPGTRALTHVDPVGRQTVRVFDDQARLLEHRAPDKPRVAYTYDSSGRVVTVTEGDGASAATTTYAYETSTGRVIETRPDGTTVTTTYDGFDNLVHASTDGENVGLVLDPARAALQLRSGARPATSLGYSAAGRETAVIPPVVGSDSAYEITTYTTAGRVARIAGPDNRLIEFAYDAAGRASSWSFDRGTSTSTYGARTGLLDQTVAPGGVTTSFAYDGSIPIGLAWAGPVTGDVRVSANGFGQPTVETVNGSDPFEFAYDPGGLLTGIDGLAIERDASTGLPRRTTLGVIETTRGYDGNGRLIEAIVSVRGDPVLSVRYSRDPLGRLVGAEWTRADGKASVTTYAYDTTGRLASVDRDGADEAYAYDASGNRLEVRSAAKAPAAVATFDDRDRLVTLGNDRFRSSPDGTMLERDGSSGRTRYDFDDLGALRSVVLPDGTRIEYVLDADGRRVGRMVDGVLTDGYLYGVDDRIVAWLDGTGRVAARFAYDDLGHLALVRRDGKDLVVVTDQLGSPIALIDSRTGTVVEEIAYDAWGNLLRDTSPQLLPFGFAGGLWDPRTALVHFGARDYDPSTGRWTAPDPLRYLARDANLYRYAGDDPVNLVDPTGLSACSADRCPSAGDEVRPLRRGPRGPVSPGSSHDKPGWGYRPPGQVGQPRNPYATFCMGPCYRNGEGVSGGTPGGPSNSPEFCFGLCLPPTGPAGTGFCAGVCSAGGPNRYLCVLFCFFGEPHMVTADGERADLQVAGEFAIARSSDGSLEVQARFEPSPVVPTVTRTTAVAMRVGDDRVAFYGDPKRALVINGQAVERPEYSTTLPGGGLVERHGSVAFVRWPDGSELWVNMYATFMDFSMSPADGVAGTMVGMLGSRDGDPANDLTTRDGAVLERDDPSFRDQLYGSFTDSWRIAQQDSLFDYLAGESTATFQRPEVPAEHVTVADLDPRVRADAEALCRAMGVTEDPILSVCIFDVGMTGDPSYAGSAATVDAALERAAVPPLDLGTAIGRGQAVTGNLGAGRVDRYHFTAVAGEIVYLDAEASCDPALAWRLLRPDGALAAFETGCNDIGRKVLPTAGEWRIEVYSDGAAAGAYALKVVSVPQPQDRSISLGGSAAGSTTAIGEWHRYALEVSAGQVVYLDAEASCDTEMWWRLRRPGGTLAWFANACTDLGRNVLDGAGTWVIEVYADDQSTGAYSFRVIDVPPARETATRVGATVSDMTRRVGEWHRYGLNVAKGDMVYLDALGSCVPGVSWRLLDPDGSLHAFATTCTDIGRRVFEVAGTWTIEIYADALESGAYSFRVIGVPPVRQSSLSLGRQAAGTIGAIGEWHRYSLSVAADQRIVIDAQGDCVDDLWWRLQRDGSLVAFAKTCTDSAVQTLDAAGEWTIEVYSDSQATGAYAFTVNEAP